MGRTAATKRSWEDVGGMGAGGSSGGGSSSGSVRGDSRDRWGILREGRVGNSGEGVVSGI